MTSGASVCESTHRVGRSAVGMLVAASVAWFVAGEVTAQQRDDSEETDRKASEAAAPAGEDATRGRVISIQDSGVEGSVRRPEGWVNFDSDSRAVAAFRATIDAGAQIEVRLSSPVRASKSKSFFNSFHSELKTAGFRQVGEPSEQTYGSKAGRETEYEGETETGSYRLLVWEFYRDRTAWIVTGFFRAERRERHVDAYRAVAESLSFEGSGEP